MRPPLFALVVVAALFACAPVIAAEGGFISTLSTTQQSAVGLTHLSAAEQTVLNTLVAREVSLARQGNVRGFAGTFSSRRRPEEKSAAGLDRLSAAELAQLDQLVANAIAAGPVVPATPQKLTNKDVARTDRLEIHGEISLAYGWGSGGRDMRAGSIYTEIYDRQTGTTVGIGYSQVSGNGAWGYGYPYDYPLDATALSGNWGYNGRGFRDGTCRRH
jgi:hypothetical protein